MYPLGLRVSETSSTGMIRGLLLFEFITDVDRKSFRAEFDDAVTLEPILAEDRRNMVILSCDSSCIVTLLREMGDGRETTLVCTEYQT